MTRRPLAPVGDRQPEFRLRKTWAIYRANQQQKQASPTRERSCWQDFRVLKISGIPLRFDGVRRHLRSIECCEPGSDENRHSVHTFVCEALALQLLALRELD